MDKIKKEKLRNVENDGRPSAEAAGNRFTIYHPVPDFKHSSYTRAQWTAQSVTYEILANLYIYIYTLCNIKLRENEESGDGLKFRLNEGGKKSVEF